VPVSPGLFCPLFALLNSREAPYAVISPVFTALCGGVVDTLGVIAAYDWQKARSLI
jgi:hypothetical protein